MVNSLSASVRYARIVFLTLRKVSKFCSALSLATRLSAILSLFFLFVEKVLANLVAKPVLCFCEVELSAPCRAKLKSPSV